MNFFDGAPELDPQNLLFVAQITGSTQTYGTNYYDWIEVGYDPVSGDYVDLDSARQGSSTSGPFLVELNNNQIMPGTYVWVRLRCIVAGQSFYDCQFCCGTEMSSSSSSSSSEESSEGSSEMSSEESSEESSSSSSGTSSSGTSSSGPSSHSSEASSETSSEASSKTSSEASSTSSEGSSTSSEGSQTSSEGSQQSSQGSEGSQSSCPPCAGVSITVLTGFDPATCTFTTKTICLPAGTVVC